MLRIEGDASAVMQGRGGDKPWLACRIIEKRFDGAGDSSRLAEIIGCFREFVESSGKNV